VHSQTPGGHVPQCPMPDDATVCSWEGNHSSGVAMCYSLSKVYSGIWACREMCTAPVPEGV